MKKYFIFILYISWLLNGCSSGGSDTIAIGSIPPAPAPAPETNASTVTLQSKELLFAQTHALPKQGLSWTLTDTSGNTRSTTLTLVGKRDALVLVDIAQPNPINPVLEVWLSQQKVGTLNLAPSQSFPVTESFGSAFRSNSYTTTIPAKWVKQGLNLKLASDNYSTSAFLGTIIVGADTNLTVNILPFYVYGAAPGVGGAPTLAQTQMPNLATQQETFAKWPVSALNTQTHPAGLIQWPYMIISPRSGNAAYRAITKNDQKGGFDTMSAVLKVMGAMRSANGESTTNNLYYAPLLMADNTGTYRSPGGGLGGGHVGTGDFSYGGIYIHEQGHALSLPHQGTAYLAGKYPYIDGSLKGSAWGYDQIKHEFLAPFVPSSASRYANCYSNPSTRPTDSQGRCVKRDPMWGGNGDQAAGYSFATFSDFSTGQMQANIQNMVMTDSYSATGFSRWDNTTHSRIDVPITTKTNGLYGLDNNLPIQTGVPVHSIIITLSNAPCNSLIDPYATCNAAGINTMVSQIYTPVSYTGNYRRVIDPTIPSELASVIPDTSLNPWYCKGSGCDYTLKVTYSDTTTWQAVLQGGFRGWFTPTTAPSAVTQDPLQSASFKTWAINAPGRKSIFKIELLHTPQVWNGLPATPVVLLSR